MRVSQTNTSWRWSFWRDTRGVTVIEFALVALPFFAVIVAILQTAIAFLSEGCLETAVEKAGRLVLTGSVQTQGLTQAQFGALVCSNLPSLLQCSNLMVDAQVANTFASANTSAPTLTYDQNGNVTNQWQYNVGGPGDIVVLRLLYLLPVVGGPLNFTLSNTSNGKRLMMATAVIKNEPFQ